MLPLPTARTKSMMDYYTSGDAPSTDYQLDRESLHKEIERVILTLTEREQKVMRAFTASENRS